jgi:hypothetical protein
MSVLKYRFSDNYIITPACRRQVGAFVAELLQKKVKPNLLTNL